MRGRQRRACSDDLVGVVRQKIELHFNTGDPSIKKIALANPEHAPYGRAAVAAIKHENIYDKVSGKFVLGENISQAAPYFDRVDGARLASANRRACSTMSGGRASGRSSSRPTVRTFPATAISQGETSLSPPRCHQAP